MTSPSGSNTEYVCVPEDRAMIKAVNERNIERVQTRENAENFLWVPKK